MGPEEQKEVEGAIYVDGKLLTRGKLETVEPTQDSWLIDGDCRVCRRKKYCSKACKKHRIRVEQETRSLIHGAIIKRLVERKARNPATENGDDGR